jgi:hypothetical protein
MRLFHVALPSHCFFSDLQSGHPCGCGCASNPPLDGVPVGLANFLLQHLADRASWQRLHEVDTFGRFHRAEFLLAQRDQFLGLNARTGVELDDRLRRLAPYLVRHADDGAVLQGRVEDAPAGILQTLADLGLTETRRSDEQVALNQFSTRGAGGGARRPCGPDTSRGRGAEAFGGDRHDRRPADDLQQRGHTERAGRTAFWYPGRPEFSAIIGARRRSSRQRVQETRCTLVHLARGPE